MAEQTDDLTWLAGQFETLSYAWENEWAVGKEEHDSFDEARERAKRIIEGLQWRPIETAPDMENVLASDGEEVWLAWYCEIDGQWEDATMGDRNGGEIYPTHWMPLPAPSARE